MSPDQCPYCESDIQGYAYDYFYKDPGRGDSYDMECPECKKVIEIQVEACPILHYFAKK